MNPKAVWGILVAGGSGQRFSHTTSKLLVKLQGKTVLQRSVEALLSVPELEGLAIVYHPQWESDYRSCIAPLKTAKRIVWAIGGESRRDSVFNGLQAMPENAGIVIIHDAARPLVSVSKIQAAIEPLLSGQSKATSLGIPMRHTLKQVKSQQAPWVEATLDRSIIWQVHTPQAFEKATLIKAHQTVAKDATINDDAELMERYQPNGQAVLMIPDSPANLKITTPEDVQLAEAYLATQHTEVAH